MIIWVDLCALHFKGLAMFEIKEFGVCNLTVVPVRASDSDESEIVTQLLFGDIVSVIEKGRPWIKVRCASDGYEGWMDFKQLSYIDAEEFKQLDTIKPIYLAEPQTQVQGPNGIQTLFLGSRLTGLKGDVMIFGNEQYIFSSPFNNTEYNLIKACNYYLNAPYLWGGKSLFSIDCSGIVQNVFKPLGIELPRDASKQVFEGELIPFEDRQVGDVPFFINSKGKVHHVGVLTEKNEIIHAAGCVRKDKFDEKGIYREDFSAYTHHYHSIRRFKL